eukprot:11221069-Alexandrium_andersonii.AAC.1
MTGSQLGARALGNAKTQATHFGTASCCPRWGNSDVARSSHAGARFSHARSTTPLRRACRQCRRTCRRTPCRSRGRG